MAILNIALFSALLPAVLAVPQQQHGHSLGHGPYKGSGSRLPTGYPTGGPFAPSGAPYPAGNSTAVGPTASGIGTGGPVTIQSTINVLPQPLSTSAGVGESPVTTGAAGALGSSAGGPGGNGVGQAGSTCGPPTVTVTQANTVTVTVPASPSQALVQSGGAPAQLPTSAPAQPLSAPYPAGNTTAPVPATGTVGTSAPVSSSVPFQSPTSQPSVVHSSTGAGLNYGPIPIASSSSAPAPSSSVVVKNNVANPVQAGTAQPSTTPEVSSTNPAAPNVVPSSASAVPSVPTSSAASTPAASSTLNTNSGVKARGILYAGSGTSALAAANNFGLSNIGWGWNWDSSPAPAIGSAQGTLNTQYVPCLWSDNSNHIQYWDNNSKNAQFLLAFNEPDLCVDGSACMPDVSKTAASWKQYLGLKRSPSVKVGTPATTNELNKANVGLDYMRQFLKACDGCKFDFLCFHWYGQPDDVNSTPGSLQATITAYKDLASQYSIPEIWLTEFAPTGASSTQLQTFLTFLDSDKSGIARYAVNGLGTVNGVSLTGAMASAYSS